MGRIRLAGEGDLESLYAISLATGLAGGDASHLYADSRLLGHIYSVPYACLEPTLALVVEDEHGVAGFAVGATDTIAWEARQERDWWPALRRRYPDPQGDPGHWTADQRRCAMIHHPERTPTTVAGAYPAHLHLNLLPRLQHQGWGRRLLADWLERVVQLGVTGVHVGVNRANEGAIAFWSRQGFGLLAEGRGGRTAWLGCRLRPPR